LVDDRLRLGASGRLLVANWITIGRIVLLFVGVTLLVRPEYLSLVLGALIAFVVVAADAVDGMVARWRGETSRFGAVFDIVGDRIVEAVYFVTYANLGAIPLGIPLVVISRGFLVDGLRGLALEDGRTAFGPKTMMASRLGRALTSSRVSRAAYGVAKGVVFVILPLALALKQSDAPPTPIYLEPALHSLGELLAYLVAGFCIVRGLLVLHDARQLIRAS
jgi:CDP-diacylglycerol---glycerol-3-phosphate 3-phosphatidyltransferase